MCNYLHIMPMLLLHVFLKIEFEVKMLRKPSVLLSSSVTPHCSRCYSSGAGARFPRLPSPKAPHPCPLFQRNVPLSSQIMRQLL